MTLESESLGVADLFVLLLLPLSVPDLLLCVLPEGKLELLGPITLNL